MKGPAQLLRGDATIDGFRNIGPLHEWEEGRAYLVLDEVEYQGRSGAVMLYSNPPVHQIGNPGLDAMLAALAKLSESKAEFLIFTWPCDPVHAGGDLKESLNKLETTTTRHDELETAGAPQTEIEELYGWADGRLDKGQALYRLMRTLSARLRTVAVCGGGMRFGGSAEVNLMADVLVGDSRSGMCFSEAMIGLIPGWAGVGRSVTKAGVANTRWMAQAAQMTKAADLHRVGIYDNLVDVTNPMPRMGRTGDKAADKAKYADDLAEHDRAVWPLLLAEGLKLATCAAAELPQRPAERPLLATADEMAAEVGRRAEPTTYREIWGQTLKEARGALKDLGRPLAPQSVAELDELLGNVTDESSFDEDAFVEAEKQADARLYRDRRLAPGIQATLEQKVADFRKP